MSPSKKILSQNGEPMLSARKVADRLKCAPDYVSKLCRDGKLQGEQIEGQWFVPQSSIAAFEESRALAKEQRAQELGQQRRSENLEYKIHHAPFPTRVLARAQTFAAGSTIGAVAGVVMLVGAAVFASTMHAPKTTSLAAVSQAESAFFGTQPPAVKISAGEALQNASGFLSGVFATLFGSDSASPSAGSNIADGGAPQGDGPRTEQIPSKESAYPESADVAKSSGPTTVVQNTYPVIERTVVREVASGGVSEEYVSLRLQDLYNRLAVQISDLQNPGRESPHQNFAVSQVINNLSDVRLNNVTTADDINADFVNTSRLDVSGQANFAAGITAATTTLSSLVVPGTSTLGSTTVTNLAVTNLSTSTFAGSLQTTGALAVGGNQYSAFKLSVNGLAYIGDPTEPYPGLVPGDELEAQLVIRRDTAAATVVLRNMDATTEAAGIIAFANSSDDQDGKIQLNGTAATTLSGSRSFNLMSNFGDIGFWRDYSGGGTPVNTLTIKGTSAGSTAGFVGIGTSSPAVNLAVQGNGLVSGTFTAGSIVATSSFTLGGNATINGGFAAYASSTIGNGNQNAGLTVFGGATTTGNAYFAGGVGIGIATSTAGVLQTSGNAYIGGNLTVVGNSVTLGASSANTLSVVSSLTSNLTPNQNITYDLGSPSFYWRNAYIGTLNANNISAANTQISGTQSADFTVNSDNVSADAEDANLIFFRGNVVPNAVLGWNSTDKRFTLNQSTFIQNASTNNLAGVTLDLKGQSGQTGALFNVASSSATSYFHITSAGRVGIGTTTPATSLDIYATDALHIPTGTTAQRPSMNFAGQVRYNTTTHQFEGYGDNNVWQGLGGVIDADQDTYITADTGNADEDFLRFFTAGSQRLTISNLGLVTVASGFLSQASSTIGAGTQTTGLTVFGGATTTGNAYVAGTVGIGTATPTDKLQVSGGDIGITGSGANLSFRGPQAANVGHQGFFDLNLITNGVSRITVKDGGNVGVGSSTPWGLLSVNANVLGSGAPQFVVGSSTKTDLIVTSAGLVGIGTTTPLNTLDVSSSGTAKVQIYSTSNTGASSVQVQNTDGDNAEYLQYGRSAGSTYFGLSRAGLAVLGGSPQSAMAVGTRTSTPLVFATNNVEVARFSSAGNFGVGTTSPTARLDVAGSNNGTSPLLQVSSVASFATTTRLLVDSSGNVGISTTSPAQTLAVGGTGYFSGNVGIGGTNSSSRLHVANINSSTFSGSNSATWNSVATVQNTTNATGANALINLYTGGGNVNTVFGVVQNASGRGDLVWGAYQGSSVFAENMRLTDQGNLGIGTTTPAQTLSVQGNQYTSGTAFFGGAITATSTLSLSGLGTLASGFVSQASSTVVGNFKTAGITNMDGLNVMFNPTGLSGGGGPWAGTYDFQADSSYSLNRTSLGIVPPVGKTVADLRVYNGADVLNSGLMQFGYDDRGFWQVATNYNGSGTARSLHLHAAASPMSGSEINKQFVLLPTGYIGIGTDSPQSNFSITGSSGVPGNAGIFEITTGTGASTDDKLVAGVVDGSYAWLQAVDPGNAFRNLVLNPSGGSVGIGTTTPSSSYKLSVVGQSQFTNVITLARADTTAAIGYIGPYTNIVGGGNTQTDPTIYTATGNLLLAGGKVGIGTSSPLATLDVVGANNGTAPIFQVSTLASFATTTRLLVNSSGNVGISTNNPGSQLAIVSSAAAHSGITITNTNSSGSSNIYFDYSGTGSSAPSSQNLGRIWAPTNANDLYIGTGQAGGDGAGIIFKSSIASTGSYDTELMRLTRTGNVGLASTTPWAQLSVNPSGVAGPALAIGSSTQTIFMVHSVISPATGGLVGINISRPAALLDIAGGASNTDFRISRSGNANAYTYLTSQGGNNNAGILGIAGTPVLTFQSNGGVQLGNYSNISDTSRAAPANGLIVPGNTGVGTTSPWGKLSVHGVATDTGGQPLFVVASSTASATTTHFIIANSGNVGIGTTSPQATLGIQGSVGVNSTQLILNANGSVGVGGAGGGAKFTINGNGGTSSHGQLDISNTAFSANVASIGIESASNSIVNGGALGDFSIASPANLILGTSNGGMVKINNASTAQAQFYGWSQLSTDSRDGALFLGSAAQFRGVLQYGVGAATPILSLDNTYDDVGAAIQFRTRTSGSSTTTVMTLTGNGNVGIGTTSPRARLDVAGANNGTAPLFQVSSVSSFATTTRLIIDSSGNVGIGTTSPYAKLSMGSVSTGTGIALDPADSGIVLASYNSSASNAQQLVIKHALGLVDISNVRGNALTMQTSGGNLGVGTTSPLARLSVTGTGASTGLTFQTTNSSNVPMFTVMDQGNVGVGTASPFSGYSLGTYERVVGLSSTVDNSMVGFGMNVTEGSSNRRAAWFLDDSTGTWGMRGTASSGGVGDFLLTTGFNTEGFRVTNGSASASGGVGQNIKVGVSSSTPYAKLAVHANDGETTRALFAIGSSTASATTTLFVVTNTGAVGIATSAPEKPLDVWGTSGQLQVGRTSVGAWYTNITNNALMSSMFGELQFTPSGAQGSNTSAFEVTNSSGTVQHAFLTTGVSYFAGNMGIATTSPYARLSVKGAGNSGATTPVQITDSSDRSLFSISDQGTIASVFRGTLGAATSSIGGPINLGATLSSANYLDGIPNSQVFITASGATNSDTLTLGNTGATSPGAGINFQSGLTGVDSRLRTAGHIYSGNTAGGYSSTYLTLGTASAFSTYRDELTLKTGSVGVGSTTPYARLSVDTTTLGSTNAFVVGSSTVTDFIVTNGGRVGVGSSAAAIGAAKMYVNGTGTNGLVVDTTDTTNAFSLLVGGSYKWTQFVASNDLNFYDQTGGASRLTLQDTSGFVGIGNTSPGEILDIALAQNATSSLKLRNSNSSSNASARFVLGNNSDAQDAFFQLNSSANTSYGGARSLNIVANAGSIAFTNGYLNPSPSMLITSAGLVGIGTTTPGSLLSLGSIANFTTATTTFYSSGGINLTGGGCFAVAGTCIGSQNGILAVYATSTVGTTTVNFNGAVNSSPSFSAGVLTLPSNTSYVTVEVWGAGGGGAGANSTTGASGGMTCFGTNATACSSPTLSATGGTGGSGNGAGGAGGSGSGGDVNLTGGGGGGGGTTLTNTFFPGGTGGVSPLGGTNGSTNYAGNSNGSAFGGGGSGGGVNNNAIQAPSGSGGGAGGYSSKLILSLNSSYKFAVGAGGAGTANGATGGSDGGNGGAGGVKITVYTTSNTNIGTGSTQQPTQTALTSGSGTYNVPAGTSYIRVRMVGAGGGGGGATGSGTSGGTSSFGSFTAVGGTFGVASGAGGAGGTGGSGTANLRIPGGRGGTSVNSDTHSQSTGGSGGSTAFGSAQGMTANTTDGSTGVTNTGSGGSGSGGDMLVYGSGSGGGGGEYVELLVTSPSASYSYAVGAGGSGGAGTKVGGAGAAGMIIIDEYYGSSSNISSSGVISSGTAGQFGFFQSNGTTLTGTSTLFLTTSGNIGIGTTTPTSNFVVSSVNQQAGTSALLTVASTTGTSLFSVFGNGSVSIGTTSSQFPLTIYNATNPTLLTTNSNGGGFQLRFQNYAVTNGHYFQVGPSDSNNNFAIFNQSNVGMYLADGGTSWSNTSDQRLKTNIQTLTATSGLESILRLNPVTFNWKDVNTSPETTHLGFIAQEVQEIFPELVNKSGTTTATLADGSTIEVVDTLGVDYTGLIPPLVKATQELNFKIETRTGGQSTTTVAALAAGATTTPGIIENMSSTLITAIAGVGNMVVRVFDGAISATVGIFNTVYAKEIHADLVCATKSNGEEVCIDGDQLAAVLDGTATSTPQGGDNGGGGDNNGGDNNASSTPPVITLIGADPAELNVGDVYSDLGVTIESLVSPNIGYTISLDGATSTPPNEFTLDTSSPGTHVILYSATDQNNQTGTATRTVIVTDPNI